MMPMNGMLSSASSLNSPKLHFTPFSNFPKHSFWHHQYATYFDVYAEKRAASKSRKSSTNLLGSDHDSILSDSRELLRSQGMMGMAGSVGMGICDIGLGLLRGHKAPIFYRRPKKRFAVLALSSVQKFKKYAKYEAKRVDMERKLNRKLSARDPYSEDVQMTKLLRRTPGLQSQRSELHFGDDAERDTFLDHHSAFFKAANDGKDAITAPREPTPNLDDTDRARVIVEVPTAGMTDGVLVSEHNPTASGSVTDGTRIDDASNADDRISSLSILEGDVGGVGDAESFRVVDGQVTLQRDGEIAESRKSLSTEPVAGETIRNRSQSMRIGADRERDPNALDSKPKIQRKTKSLTLTQTNDSMLPNSTVNDIVEHHPDGIPTNIPGTPSGARRSIISDRGIGGDIDSERNRFDDSRDDLLAASHGEAHELVDDGAFLDEMTSIGDEHRVQIEAKDVVRDGIGARKSRIASPEEMRLGQSQIINLKEIHGADLKQIMHEMDQMDDLNGDYQGDGVVDVNDLQKALASNKTYYTSTEDAISRTKGKLSEMGPNGNGMRFKQNDTFNQRNHEVDGQRGYGVDTMDGVDTGDVVEYEEAPHDYYYYDEEQGVEHRADIVADVEQDLERKLSLKPSPKKKRKKSKKKKVKLKKRKSKNPKLRLNLEQLNDDHVHKGHGPKRRHSLVDIEEVEVTSTSTGRMNMEIINILTELPLILTQTSKKLAQLKHMSILGEPPVDPERNRHPAFRKNDSRKNLEKITKGGCDKEFEVESEVTAQSGTVERSDHELQCKKSFNTQPDDAPRSSFRDSTVSFTLKEHKKMTYEHPNVAIMAAHNLEMKGKEGDEIRMKISKWKKKADKKEREWAKKHPFEQDDVREFKMWIYGPDWQQHM